MFEKQKQEAGDNSQQFQAQNLIVNTGIDEKRAREIVDERLASVLSSYSLEAQETGKDRIQLFADILLPKEPPNKLPEMYNCISQ